MAKPIRCVYETLPPRARRRWLLITTRWSISNLTGSDRTLVAVGTVSEMSMFLAVRAGRAPQDDPLRFFDVHVGPDRRVRRIGRYAAAGAWRRRPALGGLGGPFHRRRPARGGRSTRRSRLRGCLGGCRCRSRGGRRLGHLGLGRSRLLGLRGLRRGRLAVALTVSRPATRFGCPRSRHHRVAGARCAVRLEVRHPALVDRAGVSGVLLVHLLQQPVVRSEVGVFAGAGGCLVGHGGHCRLLPRVHVAGVDPPSTYAQAGHSLGYPRLPTRERLVTRRSNVA